MPTSRLIIEDLVVTRRTVWVADMDGGPQQLRAFDLDGRPQPAPEIPPVSSVSSYSARLSKLGPDRIAWSCESFIEPPTWWVAADGEVPRPTALTTTSPVDLSGYEVTREFATSWDGTRVPLNIIAAPGTPRDGSAPALLTAYGGYAISLVPKFNPELMLWLERGGVVVVANIRGGGEYGQEWHHAGRLATKQNCFDDFIACADHLVESGITTRELLSIIGGSNGGLLMGAVTHAAAGPGPCGGGGRARDGLVALRDHDERPLQHDRVRHGGGSDGLQGAAGLLAVPQRQGRDGLPRCLLTAGENDTRVDAWHAKKMTARLQAATTSGRPVLLRLESGGHLAGSLDQNIDETTDIHAFLFDQLGLGYPPDVSTAGRAGSSKAEDTGTSPTRLG